MLVRYKKSEGGRLKKTAEVYVKKEHGIGRGLIDSDALKIISRLRSHNHTAYVVGGAVRDLLLGKHPKDFDIVTDAEPAQIKKLFRNSRIIGKRFRLVHIFFGQDRIIEVSTFRSQEAGTFNNLYGSIEEDAWRRDFTINGLYYDPHNEQIIDFVRGYRDLRARKLKPIIPLNRIFDEDPVRMLRAIKYSASTSCRIGFFLKRRINKSRALMDAVSPSRITEEVFKILQGGKSLEIVRSLRKFGLLASLLPRIAKLLDQGDSTGFTGRFYASLQTLDRAFHEHRESRRSIQLSYLLSDYLFSNSEWVDVKRLPFPQVYSDIKDLLKPVTPPNIEVERALIYLIRKRKAYQKLGTLPLSEPEDGPPLGMETGTDVDMGDFHDQRRQRRRRGGSKPQSAVLPAATPIPDQGARSATQNSQPESGAIVPKSSPRRRPRKPRTPSQ